MKTQATPVQMIFLFTSVVGTLFTPFSSRAQGNVQHVEIRGEVLVDDTIQDCELEVVEVDNRVCVPLGKHPNGRFELILDAGAKAYLRFEKNGYLTKEILIDTRNADITRKAVRKNKLLRFAVEMTPELPDKQFHYAGPVGTITFVKGTGLMQVRYDRSLVRVTGGDIIATGDR